jgi:hypothetical protein
LPVHCLDYAPWAQNSRQIAGNKIGAAPAQSEQDGADPLARGFWMSNLAISRRFRTIPCDMGLSFMGINPQDSAQLKVSERFGLFSSTDDPWMSLQRLIGAQNSSAAAKDPAAL